MDGESVTITCEDGYDVYYNHTQYFRAICSDDGAWLGLLNCTGKLCLKRKKKVDFSCPVSFPTSIKRLYQVEKQSGLGAQVNSLAKREVNAKQWFKGEVRTINDRNICERRSCMKNNGKSPIFKFVSGEERRPSEVQRVSRAWRHALVSGSHLDPKMTGNSGSGAVSRLESVVELGSCCSNLDKQVSDEICGNRKRQFEIPFRL